MRIVSGLIGVLLCCTTVIAAQGPPPAKVVTARVTQQEISENRSVIGVLYYERVSDISTEVAGLVDAVTVNQGDRVKKGEVLVRLNTEILDQEIAMIKTRIEQADLRIENTRKNFQRLEELYKQAGISEKDFDDARFIYEDAQKEKQASQDTLKKLMIRKRRSVIKAPFDGIILSKDVDAGAWAQQGRQLVKIGSSADLYVRAPIAEDMLKFVRKGENLPVVITAFQKEITGKMVDIDPMADIKTKNVFLKIGIPPLPMVAQNMSATVYVPAGEKRKLSILPRAALIKFQGKDFVYTIKEGKAAILPVHIVAYMGPQIGVDNPYIVPGMPVVTEGNERLRPDQPVMVAGEK